jgi:hypothetical protein
MGIPADFEAEALYDRDAWFIHDVLEIDAEARRGVAGIDTTRLGPLVDAQRAIEGHPKHFPGAIAIQVTGTLGQLLATYVLGLRASEGWVGFGTTIKRARYPRLGVIGPPVQASATIRKARQHRGIWHVTIVFSFEQDGQVIYESEQMAAWTNPSA